MNSTNIQKPSFSSCETKPILDLQQPLQDTNDWEQVLHQAFQAPSPLVSACDSDAVQDHTNVASFADSHEAPGMVKDGLDFFLLMKEIMTLPVAERTARLEEEAKTCVCLVYRKASEGNYITEFGASSPTTLATFIPYLHVFLRCRTFIILPDGIQIWYYEKKLPLWGTLFSDQSVRENSTEHLKSALDLRKQMWAAFALEHPNVGSDSIFPLLKHFIAPAEVIEEFEFPSFALLQSCVTIAIRDIVVGRFALLCLPRLQTLILYESSADATLQMSVAPALQKMRVFGDFFGQIAKSRANGKKKLTPVMMAPWEQLADSHVPEIDWQRLKELVLARRRKALRTCD